MRPLNRPMFRYGGPIKEGVMSGIREPHANGGRTIAGGNQMGTPMGNRTGFKDPYWSRVGASAMPILKSWMKPWKKWKNPITIAKKVKGIPKNLQGIFTRTGTSPGITGSGAGQTFMKNLKDFKMTTPSWLRTAGTKVKDLYTRAPKKSIIGTGVAAPYAIDLAKKIPWEGVGNIIKAPYEKWKDVLGIKDKIDEKDGTDTLTEKITETNPWKEKYEALVEENKVPKKSDEEIRAERIQKYRDIMDIKGMNSEAASKSLIEASRLINESQDFKGDIRSGSLINKIIQGASKAYDKPADTKKAIDTLILKGEIEKDLNKEKNKLDNEYKRSMIAKNEAVLAQDSLAGDLRAYATKNQALPSGNTLAAFATSRGYDIKGVEDTTEVKKWMTKNGGNEVAYLQDIITKTEVAPGLYVINNKILAVDESKKITPVI